MKLVDMKVTEFLDVLKSDAPAPGGGSVSALSGAQGCGLFMMVADLTLGKEKYKDLEDICLNAKKRGVALYEELTAAVDKDTDAFNLISAAFKMPNLQMKKRLPEDRLSQREHWLQRKFLSEPWNWDMKGLNLQKVWLAIQIRTVQVTLESEFCS